MSKEIKCTICDQNAQIAIENFEGYQEGETFSIYFCPTCNTSFVHPHTVDNNIYNHIYTQSDIVPGYHRYAIYAEEILKKTNPLDYLAGKESMYFAIKEIIKQEPGKPLEILEVGSGLGYLTYAIFKEGHNITGLDISSEAVKKATNQFGNLYVCDDVYKYAVNNAEKFDIVLLTEVIEHLPDPNGFIATLMSLLKSTGKLLITTPNKSAYSINEYWDTESPPVHLSWFSEESFHYMSKKAGASLSFFDFSEFNKNHINITDSLVYEKFYKRKHRTPTLDRGGRVVFPITKPASIGGKIKAVVKNLARPLYEPLIIALFNNKKNLHRNYILCAILQKKE